MSAMLIRWLLHLVFLAAALGAPALTDLRNIQVYGVRPEPEGSMKIDGKLDEPEWRRTPSMGGFHFIDKIDARTPERQTMARLFHTKDALYLAVECLETDVPQAALRSNQVDTYWSDDCVEVYLDPGRTLARFFKLAVNPNGILWAMKVEGANYDLSWQARCGAEAAASKAAGSWTVELRVPYSGLACVPQGDDLWACNVRRIRWGKERKLEDSSWSPNAGPSNPWRLGNLYFELQDGMVNSGKLMALCQEGGGGTVEVALGIGSMLLQDNASVVDARLEALGKALGPGMDALKARRDQLQRERGQGPVTDATMAKLLAPLEELRGQVESLAWETRWKNLSENDKED